MRPLTEYINESAVTVLSKDLGSNNDKDFLSIVWKLPISEIETLLTKSKSDLKTLNSNSKGILGTFARRDAMFVKNRIRYMKEIIKSKKEKPDFIPDFVK